MVGKGVHGATARAGPRLARQPAARRGLVAQASGSVRVFGKNFTGFWEIHSSLRLVSGSARVSLSRADAYDGFVRDKFV